MNNADSNDTADISEFWRMTKAFCQGTQTAQDRDRLEAMLWSSPHLQEKYVEYVALDAELKCLFRAFDGPPISLDQLHAGGRMIFSAIDDENLPLGDASSGVSLAQASSSSRIVPIDWTKWK